MNNSSEDTMNENLKRLLDEAEKKLKDLFGKKLTNVILFGSYARGDYDEESDIDIIALVRENNPNKYNEEIIDLEIDLTIKYGIMPSILTENESYFRENQDKEFLFQNVLKEGKVVYAA